MIVSFEPNNNPMHLSGMTTAESVVGAITSQLQDAVEFCSCGCDYTEYAFYHADGEPHKNDKTSILVKKFIVFEIYTFEIYKDGVLQDEITDDTYGEYFDYGSLEYDYYKGVIVDWKLVAAAFGNGIYFLRVKRTWSGDVTTIDSHNYRVMPYSPEAAENTVKIESYQNGNFALNLSFRGMRWYQSFRVAGRLFNKKAVYKSETLINSDRQRTQVYDTMETNFTLEVRFIPATISNAIIYEQMLANELLVTDYNRFAFEVYRRLPVKLESISKSEYHTKNKRGDYVFNVVTRSEGTIKTY